MRSCEGKNWSGFLINKGTKTVAAVEKTRLRIKWVDKAILGGELAGNTKRQKLVDV